MQTPPIRPHIYRVEGAWTCALVSEGWVIWPRGKGATPRASYLNWRSQIRLPPELMALLPPLTFAPES